MRTVLPPANKLTSEEVKNEFGFPKQTLSNWSAKGCAVLGGKTLKREWGGFRYLYRRAELEQVSQSLRSNALLDVSNEWLGTREAQKLYGFTAQKLLRRAEYCPLLGEGARLPARRAHSWSGRAGYRDRWFFRRADLENLRLKLCKGRPPEWVDYERAQQEFGIPRERLQAWWRRGAV
jgi:hypothetical protein